MESNRSLENVLEGILFLHFVIETEGGYWAFQDSQEIQNNAPTGYCEKCGLYLKKQSEPPEIQPVITLNKKTLEGREYTKEIKKNQDCIDNGHEELIGTIWDDQGLHILKNGDYLTIFHPKNNRKVWSGMINLKQYEPFLEYASGVEIHADQIGIKRNIWAKYFFGEYPATLIPAREHKE